MKLLGSEYNEVTGITVEYWGHTNGTSLTIRTLQDIEPIMNMNKFERSCRSQKSRKFNESEGLGTRVASIPMGAIEEIRMKTGLDLITCSDEDLKKFLNDADYARFRTAYGRV